jgi:hypothetical protein
MDAGGDQAAMCAMSVKTGAPTRSAVVLMRAKSMTRGYALAPTMIIFGLCSSASRSISS